MSIRALSEARTKAALLRAELVAAYMATPFNVDKVARIDSELRKLLPELIAENTAEQLDPARRRCKRSKRRKIHKIHKIHKIRHKI